ncbi:Cys-Gln thioester bond-forming surface protein [Streptomyces sp. NPDC008150]|uniref:Cys-Gln thioester bond-forming surface protein n=1 Tax=Streptomyces sp. NPDC008150 TaxID=3364816 RepID=UPI0036EB30F9
MSGVVVTGLAVVAQPAAADDVAPQVPAGATATIGGLKTYGDAVIHEENGDEQTVSAGLFEMSVDDGGTLQTYCVDLHNPTQKDAKYQETDWSGTSLGTNKDAGRIRWILRNSYPQVNDLAALAARAGVRSGLTEQDAAAGTQVAIWRYSDGADVDAVDPQAEKLADYLEKNARGAAEPKASLSLAPAAVSGHPGELVGPVTVHTNAGTATVAPPADAVTSGVRIVDKKGKEVTSVADGGQLYFDVPADAADGSADLTVQASATVPVGRAFTSESHSQTQILAGSSESTVSATASAAWAVKGAIPALSAAKNCAAGGVDISTDNQGDQPFTYELLGTEHTIAAGTRQTVTVPLEEDQAYDFTITGPNNFEKRFTGVLDCRTQAVAASGDSTQTLDEPSPVAVGDTTTGGVDLADTGSSGATSELTAAGLAFVAIGALTLAVIRKRRPAGN